MSGLEFLRSISSILRALALAALVAVTLTRGTVLGQESGACNIVSLRDQVVSRLPFGTVHQFTELDGPSWHQSLLSGDEIEQWRALAVQFLVDGVDRSLGDLRFVSLVYQEQGAGFSEISALRVCGTNDDDLLVLTRRLFSDDNTRPLIQLGLDTASLAWLDRDGRFSQALRHVDTVYIGHPGDPAFTKLLAGLGA